MATSTTKAPTEEPSPFTTLPAEHWPNKTIPEGMTYVTSEEMGYLRALNWGTGTHQMTCEVCKASMTFERHPADFPSHPGAPGVLRVAVECPVCGTIQHTDGMTEVEYVAERTKELDAQVREEIARRINAEVVDVRATDSGRGGESAFTGHTTLE